MLALGRLAAVWVAALAAAFLMLLQPATAERRVAFVAGINDYPNLPREMQLQRAVADAETVADTLQSLGYKVTRVTRDVTHETFLRRFGEFVGQIEPGDTAVFFFAGHGIGLGGTNYLIPADVPKLGGADERLVKSRSVAETDLISDIQNKGARVTVMVIDACRNNPFPRAGTRSLGLTRGLARVEPAEGVFSIYSAGFGQEALDRLPRSDTSPNSVFTRVFVEQLRKPGLHLLDLGETVREEVAALARSANHPQVPAVYNQVLGARSVFLAGPSPAAAPSPSTLPPPPPTPAPAPAADEIAWSFIETTSDPRAIESFIARFPNSRLRGAAEARLAKLKADAAPRPQIGALPPQKAPEPSPALPRLSGSIKVAVAGPITGGYASFGSQLKAGVEQAVEDINGAGGLLGQKLVLEIGDDACDPKQAVAAANQLVGRGVKFVAGHFCSGSSIPASKVYAEADVIQVSPASTNPRFTDERAGRSIYRIAPRDDQQGEIAGKFLAARFRDKNIAILHDKSIYGKGLADEVKRHMNAAGKKEKFYGTFTSGDKDFTTLVSKLKSENIDVLYVGGYHTEAGLILRQMRDRGMKTLLVSGDALVTDEFWSIAGRAGEGTLMTFQADARKRAQAAAVVAKFRQKGIEPEGYVLYAYAAVQAWAQAVEKAGSVETARVVGALDSAEFNTVLGKVRFDAKGDVMLPGYVFYVWKDGKYDEL